MAHSLAVSLLIPLSLFTDLIFGYVRKPCRRQDRVNFQLPDCYLPSLETSLLLSSASFLLSHNAATGYIQPNKLSAGALTSSYAKTQAGTLYDQLNDGARALDLRPKLLLNGTVIFQHGDININVSFEQVIADAVRWCNDNPDELVLLLPSHMAYEQSSTNDGTNEDSSNNNAAAGGGDNTYEYDAINVMAAVYSKLGVPYVRCSAVYGLTVAETMELAKLPSGGYLLALDGQDDSASFCGKDNWIEDKLVTCYPQDTNPNVKCTNGPNSVPMTRLKEYVLASANNEATDSQYALGPPADLEQYPFNEIQALWQVDTHSAAVGITHLSTLLNDNEKSGVNQEMVRLIHSGAFNSISLFAVDNVASHGSALLSVLRTQCGQTSLEDCGTEISLPRMAHTTMSKFVYFMILAMIFGVIARGIIKRREHSETKR